MLLRRTGSDGEDELKGAEIDFRTIKSLDVIPDLHSVVAWVKKRNATY